MRFIRLFIHAVRDYFVRILPAWFSSNQHEFVFLIHARNITDIRKKYPFFKYIPNTIAEYCARKMWPVVASEVTGLKSLKTGKEVKGLIIGFIMTAPQMMNDRKAALKKIIDSAKLAKKMGANIIGLGGLISSLSKGGLDIINEVDINITTGHAYTAFTVAANVNRMSDMFSLSKDRTVIAIVGASGSIGSSTAQLIARDGFKEMILIDLDRKLWKIDGLISKLKLLNPNLRLEITSDMMSIKRADIIVTATNAADAVVKNRHLKKGSIIVDDAQPSDVAPEVFENEDVLAIEAGIVHTPNINSHFNFGLKDKYDNFCCMCEIMILAANDWDEHYVVDRADLELIDKIVDLEKGLGFRLAELQNFNEVIHRNKIKRIKKILTLG